MNRPLFNTAWMRFQEINQPATVVGRRIGGNVGLNLGSGAVDNAAAVRVSFVLNRAGLRIPRIANCTISGSDGSWYFTRVRDLHRYLRERFGDADIRSEPARAADFLKQRGLLVFDSAGGADGGGHATLWNGTLAADACDFSATRDARLWRLR